MNYDYQMSPLVKSYTLDEFERLPDAHDGAKLELIAGVLYVTPPLNHKQKETIGTLRKLLEQNYRENNLTGKNYGEKTRIKTGLRHTSLEPDIMLEGKDIEWIFYTPLWALDEKEIASNEPNTTLVIENVTVFSETYIRNTKKDTYAALKVRELWLVDETLKTVEVFNLAGERYDEGRALHNEQKIVSQVLPFVSFTAAEVFR